MLPAPPNEFKSISPFLQRSAELKSRDQILSYYCLLHATTVALAIKSDNPAESRPFLASLLDNLEQDKAALKGAPEIEETVVGSAHVENFALRIFSNADNQDRAGNADRKTAKSFFAAASFLQVLAVFGELSLDVCLFALRLIDATGLKTQEKIKYAKWKATDIIKALNEGRKPVPGNPLEEEAPIQNEESHFSTLQTSVDQSKSTNFIQPPSTQIVDMPPNPPGYDPYSPSLPPPVENISRRFGNTSFGSPVLQEASQAPYTNSSQLETDAHQPHSAQCIQPQAAFQSPSVPSTSYPPTTYEQKGNAAFNPNLSGSTPGHHQQIAPVANPADPASQVPVIQSISSQPTSARDSDPFAYDYEGIANAQKACKHAMSCIQFDDIENAVANLQKAMNLLKPFLQKKS